MERKDSEKIKKSSRGGARKNAGRPRGSTDRVTIAGLLAAVESQQGRSYVDMLAEDFADARQSDRHLAMKYHNLILNKVAATLTAVEVTDPEHTVEQRRRAFVEAMAQITQNTKTQ
jgi:hypothetical protein